MADDRKIDERDVRRWFVLADINEAMDTFNVIAGILETRQALKPKRRRRSDAGTTRDKDPGSQGLLDG